MAEMTPHEFSVVQFFSAFQQAIAKINTYPLTTDNLVVQTDAYGRLGSDIELDEPVAVLEFGRKERDSDIRFFIELSHTGIAIGIEQLDVSLFEYSYFKSEAEAVEQLIAVATVVSNGQLQLLETSLNDTICAKEALLKDKGADVPLVIGFDAKYPWWVRADTPADAYDTSIYRNSFKIPAVALPKQFLLVPHIDNTDSAVAVGRTLRTAEITPLTKQEYIGLKDEIDARFIGKAPGDSINAFLYRQWEFWVLLPIIGASAFWLSQQSYTPSFIKEHPIALAIPVLFMASVLTGVLLGNKEVHKARGKNTIYMNIDRLIKKILPTRRARTKTKGVSSQRKVNRARSIEPVGWLVNGVFVIIAGYIYATQTPPELSAYGTPELIGAAMLASGIVTAVLGIGIKTKFVSDGIASQIAGASAIGNIVLITTSTKEGGTDSTQAALGVAFLLCVIGALIMISASAYRNIHVGIQKSLED